MSLEPHDQAFARFAATGRPRELAAVFDATAAELRQVAAYLTRTADEADDLLQNTFLAAIEHRREYAADEPVLPWLLGILANRARRLTRERARRPDPRRLDAPRAGGDPLEAAHASELHEALDSALAALPEPYGSLLGLHLVEGLGAQEIAERVARPAGSVRKQLSRGMDRLRQALPAGLAGALVVAGPARSLAPIRAAVLAAAAQGVLVTSKLALGLGAATLVALGGLAFAFLNRETPPAGDPANVAGTGVEFPRGAREGEAQEPRVPLANERPSDETREPPALPMLDVRGRIVLADGKPFADQDGAWLARPTHDARAPLEHLYLRSDGDGAFALRVAPWPAGSPPQLVVCDDRREFGASIALPANPPTGEALELGTLVFDKAKRLVAGRVLDADGKAAQGLVVALHEADGAPEGLPPQWNNRGVISLDRRGAFAIDRWSVAERLRLVVQRNGIDLGAALECTPGSEGLELRVPAPAQLRGRVLGIPELPHGTLTWTLQLEGQPIPLTGPVSGDGRFEYGPLPSGRHTLGLVSTVTGETLADLGTHDWTAPNAGTQPPLDAIRLDATTRFVRLRWTDERGHPGTGYYTVHARPEQGSAYVASSGRDAELLIATRAAGFDLIVAAPGRRLLELEALREDRNLVWPDALRVELVLDSATPSLPPGTRLLAVLEPEFEPPVRLNGERDALLEAGRPGSVLLEMPGAHVLAVFLVHEDKSFVMLDGKPVELLRRRVRVAGDAPGVSLAVGVDVDLLARVRERLGRK